MFRLEGVDCRALPRRGIAFSPNGKRIATATMVPSKGADTQMTGVVTIWDATTGREFLNLSCPWIALTSEIEFSPDGFHLIARSHTAIEDLLPGSATLNIWDAISLFEPAEFDEENVGFSEGLGEILASIKEAVARTVVVGGDGDHIR